MRNQHGFTLIELVVFITVTGLLVNVLFLAYSTALLKTPDVLQNVVARQTAKQCMEWFIGQRKLNGYSSFSCPSTTTPSFCTSPAGYTVSVNVACTTINTDANYKTVTITVSGVGDANLTTIVANY